MGDELSSLTTVFKTPLLAFEYLIKKGLINEIYYDPFLGNLLKQTARARSC